MQKTSAIGAFELLEPPCPHPRCLAVGDRGGVLQQAFTSSIARGLSLVAIVMSGLTFAFVEGGSRRVLARVLFGVGMAIVRTGRKGTTRGVSAAKSLELSQDFRGLVVCPRSTSKIHELSDGRFGQFNLRNHFALDVALVEFIGPSRYFLSSMMTSSKLGGCFLEISLFIPG
jgi:hypothetical protein